MTADFAPETGRGPLDVVKRLDVRVMLPAMLLVIMGVTAIADARPELVAVQLRWCGVGLLVVGAAVVLPYRFLIDLAWPAWGLSVALLALVLVMGEERNGATRWLQFGGIGLQPSEFAKAAHVLVLARYIRFRRDHRTFKGLVVPFLITVVPMALVLKEPDLGTAAMFVPTLFVMLWSAGARTRHLGLVVALVAASLPALYVAMPAEHYQRQRVDAFIAPVVRALDAAGWTKPAEGEPKKRVQRHDTFQRDEAVAAVAMGGFAGHASSEDDPPQHERVPESWTDFVFTVHAEEWGFVGVAALLLVWAGFVGGLVAVASELREPAGRLLAVGAAVMFGTQAIVNMAMNMGSFPVTGVPLPFVSYGGSSMLASWILLALVLNARARQPLVFSMRDFD